MHVTVVWLAVSILIRVPCPLGQLAVMDAMTHTQCQAHTSSVTVAKWHPASINGRPGCNRRHLPLPQVASGAFIGACVISAQAFCPGAGGYFDKRSTN